MTVWIGGVEAIENVHKTLRVGANVDSCYSLFDVSEANFIFKKAKPWKHIGVKKFVLCFLLLLIHEHLKAIKC